MPYFGDIFIPWLTSKDTSIAKDTVEKNFVDEPPQVYELTPDLEAGTYTAILNETVHDKNESFAEQQDAVLSMVSRHGTEFPFSVAGDDGYVIVNGANTSIDPRQEIRDASIDVRFLSDNDYNAAVVVTPSIPIGADFDSITEPHESIIALPSSVSVLNETANFTVTTEEGDLDYYIVSSKNVVEYEETNLDSQQQSICRSFDSDGLRVYSDSQVLSPGSVLTNSLIRSTYTQTESKIDFYDGSWSTVGSVQLPFGTGYTPENINREIELDFINDNKSQINRGFSVVKYTFDEETQFAFDTTDSVSLISDEDYYAHWEDGSGRDIIVVRTSSDGSFYTDTSELGIQNLTSSTEYEVFVGVVPSAFTVDDYARYVYNIGNRRNTFVQ